MVGRILGADNTTVKIVKSLPACKLYCSEGKKCSKQVLKANKN